MAGNRRHSYHVSVGALTAVFVVIILIIGIAFVFQRGWETPVTASVHSQEEIWQADRSSGVDPLMLGGSGAPVELVVYSDYQCPFCAHWSRETLPVLLEYMDEGEMSIVWRDINLSGESSERGARAVYAAALQDRFFDYHRALVTDGAGASDSDLEEAALVELADTLDLDVSRFAADMNSPEVEHAIRENMAEARSQGVTRAPSFLFDGQRISGVQPTDAFVENLDAALEKQKAHEPR